MLKDDLANPNNLAAEDREKHMEHSTNEEVKQSEENIDILSSKIEGSNKALSNHLRQCGVGVVIRSWKSKGMRIFVKTPPFIGLSQSYIALKLLENSRRKDLKGINISNRNE